jgi:hypothetical protein
MSATSAHFPKQTINAMNFANETNPPTKNGEKNRWRGFMVNPKIDFYFSILHAHNFGIFFNKLEIGVNW